MDNRNSLLVEADLMAMSKSVYESVARIFADHINRLPNRYEHGVLLALACDMADMFADDNINFDRTRFLQACGKELPRHRDAAKA
jgi:hypothetical protein